MVSTVMATVIMKRMRNSNAPVRASSAIQAEMKYSAFRGVPRSSTFV